MMVVGISDRMQTTGDIQVAPPRQRIWGLTDRIVMLVSGDISVQEMLYVRTVKEVEATGLISVEEVAECYARHYIALRQQENETSILRPLGLTQDTYLSRQRDLLPDEVKRIATNLENGALSAETIVTGVDDAGAHIYVIQDPGIVRPRNAAGFAAIGYGGRHAASQFMFAKYAAWDWELPRAMLLTYRAKLRAHAAPTVGLASDMFVINSLKGYIRIVPELMAELEKLHTDATKREDEAWNAAGEQITSLFSASPPETPGGPAGPDGSDPEPAN
jgi:hypothetical protein